MSMDQAPKLTMAVTEIPAADDRLIVTGSFASDPETLFTYWTEPERITQWWPVEATIDARPGGHYHLAWPDQSWHLRGEYTAVQPGADLAFTWQWDHEPDAPIYRVGVTFAPWPNGGSQLTLTHGTYAPDPAGQTARQGHREGWLHFLTRLQELVGRA